MSKKEKTVINEEEKLFLAKVVAASLDGNIVYCNPDCHQALLSEKLIEVNFTLKNDEDCVAARATKKAIEYLAADSAAPVVADPVTPMDRLVAGMAVTSEKLGPEKSESFLPERETVATGPENVNLSAPVFPLVDNVPFPAKAKHARGASTKWPFKTMEVGQSFFVPNGIGKDGQPFEAHVHYASSVASAIQRFAEPTGETKIKTAFVGFNANGERLTAEKESRIMRHVRIFSIHKVEDGAPWGSPGVKGAGIWRTK